MTKFKYDPMYARWAEKFMRKTGATYFELGQFLEVTERTIRRWIQAYPVFRDAVKAGAAVSDARVERCLYERAVGYSYEAEKIFCNKDGDVTRAAYIEHVPPDVTAQIFWLKNRDRDNWRDRHEVEGTGNVLWVFDDPTKRPDGYDRKSQGNGSKPPTAH